MADTLESLEIEVKHSATGAAQEITAVTTVVRALGRALSTVLPSLKSFKETLGNGSVVINDNHTTQIADTINNVRQAAGSARKATESVASGIHALSGAAKKSLGPLGNFIASLKRIAFYRIIRSVIKSITQAFSEGLQWAYQFSSGIETEGGRFADALDSMKTASTTMKSQLGSAFIGLLSAISPVIIQLINLITRLSDALSQLFAAFTGTTYLKAVEVPQQWADAAKKAGGAAKEWKNQLLGFDEINRLNEPSSGGGGGGSTLDPSTMFEDTPLEAWAMKWRENLSWIEEHMDTIKTIAAAVGIALLAWNVEKFFANLLGISPALSTILGVAIAIGGAFLFVKGAIDAWTNGVDWKNVALMIGGVTAVALGLALAFGHVAAGIALVVGGVAMLVIGIRDWIKTGELSTQTFVLMEGAIAALGVGLALLTGSWIPLAIAAVVGLVLAVYKYWEPIKDWFSRLWQSIGYVAKEFWHGLSAFFTDIWTAIKESAIKHFGGVFDGIKRIWDGIKEYFNGIVDFVAGVFIGDWDRAWSGVGQIFTGFADIVIGALDTMIGWISGLISWCKAAHDWIQDVLTGEHILANTTPSNWDNGLTSDDFLQGFASGGFPDEGQLFIARESGPEMVGTMGGRTTVATNNDIVEGIRGGVFEAVSAAMANNSYNGDVSVRVFLDSREIKSGQHRLGMAMGV